MTVTTTLPTRRDMEQMLSTRALSQATGIAEKTLNNWRYLQKGPAFIRCGGRVVYPLSAVQTWLAEGTVRTHA